ncbi:MAG: hypothetical protein ACRETZ_05985 [Steroidobacteraceae bacterium]
MQRARGGDRRAFERLYRDHISTRLEGKRGAGAGTVWIESLSGGICLCDP